MAASLLAVDPVGIGGVCLRSCVHPVREQWLELLRDLLPADAPLRRVPFNIPDGRLLGGLDLAATLKANRPIAERGILAESDGGVVVLTMAERLTPGTAARLNAVLDTGEISVPRDGVSLRTRAEIGIVALDEGMSDDESMTSSLRDRLAFVLDFNGFDMKSILIPAHDAGQILAARARLPSVRTDTAMLEALCATALALGADSPRVSILAWRVARAAAALAGRNEVLEEDAILAGRLVLAPRARFAPPAQPSSAAEAPAKQPVGETPPEQSRPPEQARSPDGNPQADAGDTSAPDNPGDSAPGDDANDTASAAVGSMDTRPLEDVVLAAAQAAIPAKLLLQLQSSRAGGRGAQSASMGRSGAMRNAGSRGRPAGVRAGPPRGRARLSVIETLRAAAPWQGIRGRTSAGEGRLRISAEDFRVVRYKQRAQTVTIFAVDASGSSALNRLAEAKGAVELLLADCYVRRDQVAVVAFRGRKAELLLPPTRSLVRAKRSLAGLPGGGGTPLAAAIDAALQLAKLALRRGETPTLVILCDGRANISRDGSPGREQAHLQAMNAAGAVALANVSALFVDTSPRPNNLAKEIAVKMQARYLPLPFAQAKTLSDAVKATAAAQPARYR
jgi:magnesium chelatase subunit D